MDVHIGEMTSTVRAVDGDSLLTPELVDRLVQAVLARLDSMQDRKRRGEAERELRNGRFARPFIEQAGGDW
jgi:hypothetical protein